MMRIIGTISPSCFIVLDETAGIMKKITFPNISGEFSNFIHITSAHSGRIYEIYSVGDFEINQLSAIHNNAWPAFIYFDKIYVFRSSNEVSQIKNFLYRMLCNERRLGLIDALKLRAVDPIHLYTTYINFHLDSLNAAPEALSLQLDELASGLLTNSSTIAASAVWAHPGIQTHYGVEFPKNYDSLISQ